MKKLNNYLAGLRICTIKGVNGEDEQYSQENESTELLSEEGGWPTQLSAPYSRTAMSRPINGNVMQYVDHPVIPSMGLTDITIPLYTVKLGEIEVPITLSYHSSGIRVAEIASTVGLGWTLNVGGIISRQINGKSDYLDDKYKYQSATIPTYTIDTDSLGDSLTEAGDCVMPINSTIIIRVAQEALFWEKPIGIISNTNKLIKIIKSFQTMI